jgi:ribonuclease P protein component
VTRNRVRRRLREAFRARLAAGPTPAAADVVVIARPDAARADYAELKSALDKALERSGFA